MIFFSRKLTVVAAIAIVVLEAVISAPAVVAKSNVTLIAAAVNSDPILSKEAKQFYAQRDFEPIWVGSKNKKRAKALIAAVTSAATHGLPKSQYRITELQSALAGRHGNRRAAAETFATKIFLKYAHDLSSGILQPRKVDKEIAVKVPRRSELALLDAISRSSPSGFFKALVPKHPEYSRLLKEKERLERLIGRGGFGDPIRSATLKLGTSSKNITKIRARLSSMGYGRLGAHSNYDEVLLPVVKQFQKDHGLKPDGVIGPGTMKALNASVEQRLKQVIVNLERERWINRSRGKRHIIVNLANFSLNVYDNDNVTFTSKVVIGKIGKERTPEFHDQMTHMVVNPTWHVPSSITSKEYLPIMKTDPEFLISRGMRMYDDSGVVVNPEDVDFAEYDEKTFPYSIKQRPSKSNALGLVKFMFPNRYNIYLHDTPSKNLFNREVRAFSHGCVRVQKPFEFAYKLLANQTSDPKSVFHSLLNTGDEHYVDLQNPVPIYLNYRTVFFDENGRMNYRNDIYGRDKNIFNALSKAGVALHSVQG
jgi:murein L,D-transpeptidase YcbB/YkuD